MHCHPPKPCVQNNTLIDLALQKQETFQSVTKRWEQLQQFSWSSTQFSTFGLSKWTQQLLNSPSPIIQMFPLTHVKPFSLWYVKRQTHFSHWSFHHRIIRPRVDIGPCMQRNTSSTKRSENEDMQRHLLTYKNLIYFMGIPHAVQLNSDDGVESSKGRWPRVNIVRI